MRRRKKQDPAPVPEATALAVRVSEEQLLAEAAKSTGAAEYLATYVIETNEQALAIGGFLHNAKDRWKTLEDERTAITSPLNESLRNVNRLFKAAQDPLKQIEDGAKRCIAEYQRRKRVDQEQAMQEVAAGDSTALVRTAPAAVLPGVSTRETWTVEVLDADQVPREFCTPDLAKLRASRDWSAYSEQHLPPPIPGVRFVRTTRVAVR